MKTRAIIQMNVEINRPIEDAMKALHDMTVILAPGVLASSATIKEIGYRQWSVAKPSVEEEDQAIGWAIATRQKLSELAQPLMECPPLSLTNDKIITVNAKTYVTDYKKIDPIFLYQALLDSADKNQQVNGQDFYIRADRGVYVEIMKDAETKQWFVAAWCEIFLA